MSAASDPVASATGDALATLARRDYSAAGLERKLRKKGHSKDAVEAACDRCRELGYLDDRRFGRLRLEGRLQRRPAGRTDALTDLRRQGLTETISESVVDEVFEELVGEETVLADAFDRWASRHGEPDDLAAAKRCFDHLIRRSFPRHLVLQKLSPWLDNLTD